MAASDVRTASESNRVTNATGLLPYRHLLVARQRAINSSRGSGDPSSGFAPD